MTVSLDPAKRDTTNAPASVPRRPYHVGVALGLSTGLYAVTLGAVASAQIEHDQAIIVDRRPMQEAISLLGSAHDRMEIRMEAAWVDYQAASGGYDGVAERLSTLQTELENLGATVTGIEGTAFSLPTRLSLPTVRTVRPAAPAAPAAAPPPTQSTTGASGL
ncbi:MAG: hypothetical protein OEW24_06935 [Chloroflexota bacterium]|nr:hypothetical protein [Chloroflexota bacterium]